MTHFPALFVSHGSPMVALQDSPARRFLSEYGTRLGKPRAILSVSAHWESAVPTVSLAGAPETIHDFGGFSPALFEMRYPAPGAPDVALAAAGLMGAAGLEVREHPNRGYDHGTWIPLTLLYPGADIPVAQLSIQPAQGPDHHRAIGEALRPLRDDGVLILASGSLTHNLQAFVRNYRTIDAPVPEWVSRFDDWIAEAVTQGRSDDLLAYRERAPFARENHPTDEHLLPLFVAMGAGEPDAKGVAVHRSRSYGVLAMDAYAFA